MSFTKTKSRDRNCTKCRAARIFTISLILFEAERDSNSFIQHAEGYRKKASIIVTLAKHTHQKRS